MLVRVFIFLLLFLCLGSLTTLTSQNLVAQESALSELEQQAFQEVAAKLAPSLVQIETVGGREMIGGQLTATAASTGVVVSAEGYIITSSYHFLAEPESILVRLADGRRLPARMVSQDSVLMVTLLKIEAENLLVAKPAPQASIRVGQWAIGLGKTFDAAIPNITVGIVSALNRVWGKANVQTDAKVSPVNYGGPIANVSGEVMGILVPLSPQADGVTSGTEWYDSGIGFAVSLEKIRDNLSRMKQGKDLKPGLLGVSLKEGGAPGLPAKIEQVRFASPAQKAGLKAGDLVTRVDDKAINSKTDFQFALKPRYAGESVRLVVKRGEKTADFEIQLTDELPPYEPGFLGILPARENRLTQEPPKSGVGIRFIYQGSPAEKAGLTTDDRIVKLNEQSVTSVDDFRKQLRLSIPKTSVKLTVLRNGEEVTRELTLASPPRSVPSGLPAVLIPAVEESIEQEDLPQTGFISEELEELKHRYQAYVPEEYHPGYRYGLVLLLNGSGEDNSAATLKTWKQVCDERGLILLAPQPAEKTGWVVEELDFLKEFLELIQQKYRVDPQRIVVHGADEIGRMAIIFGFKNRKMVQGVILKNSLLPSRLPENRPGESLQLYLQSDANSPANQRLQKMLPLLDQKKYSYIREVLKDRQQAPSLEQTQLPLWIDSLDRL